MEEIEAFDVNIIASTCNDVIDNELDAHCRPLSCAAEAPPGPRCLTGLDDLCSAMDGHPVLDPLAKPPRSFGRQMVFDEAGSPSHGQVMHHAWKMGEAPRAFGRYRSPEMGERNRRQRLRSRSMRVFQRIESLRTRSCGRAPASCNRAAASSADWPAPTTATSRPSKFANRAMAEVWVARAGGSDASSGGT